MTDFDVIRKTLKSGDHIKLMCGKAGVVYVISSSMFHFSSNIHTENSLARPWVWVTRRVSGDTARA